MAKQLRSLREIKYNSNTKTAVPVSIITAKYTSYTGVFANLSAALYTLLRNAMNFLQLKSDLWSDKNEFSITQTIFHNMHHKC